MLADIEATMHTASLVPRIAYTAGLARVMFIFFYNAGSFESGFVRQHLDDLVKWLFVELSVAALSPILGFSEVLQDPHDDRGDAASFCIADKKIW